MVKYASRLKNVTVKNTIRKRKRIICTYWLSERAGRENIWPEVMDGFSRPSSRHRARPSYGDFLNSFAMKSRSGPYGSYVNRNSYSNPWFKKRKFCLAVLVTSQAFPFLQITMLERSSIPQSTFISCNTVPKGIDILSIFELAPVKEKYPTKIYFFSLWINKVIDFGNCSVCLFLFVLWLNKKFQLQAKTV